MAIRNIVPVGWTGDSNNALVWLQNGRQIRAFQADTGRLRLEGGGPGPENRVTLEEGPGFHMLEFYIAQDQSALAEGWISFHHFCIQSGEYEALSLEAASGKIFSFLINTDTGTARLTDVTDSNDEIVTTGGGRVYGSTWHSFAIRWDCADGGTFQMLVDGRDLYTATNSRFGGAAPSIDHWRIQENTDVNRLFANVMSGDWDADGRAFKALNPGQLPPAPISVHLDPNADGAINGWAPSAGATAWEVLDGGSAPVVDDSYIGVDVAGAIQEVALEDLFDVGLEDVEILAVAVQAVARKTGGGAAGVRINLTDGTNVKVGADITLVEGSLKGILEIYEVAPDDTALSPPQVDGLRVQVESLV